MTEQERAQLLFELEGIHNATQSFRTAMATMEQTADLDSVAMLVLNVMLNRVQRHAMALDNAITSMGHEVHCPTCAGELEEEDSECACLRAI